MVAVDPIVGDLSTEKSKKRKVEDDGEKESIECRRWADLPSICLVCVFEKLSLEDLALNAPFVCKSWYDASLDPACWRILDFRTIDPLPGSSFSEKMKRVYGVDRYTFRGFLRFLIKRSNKSAMKLLVSGVRIGPTLDLIFLCKERPKLKILAPVFSEKDPENLAFVLLLKIHEAILKVAATKALQEE